MLNHPTLDKLHSLKFIGMANAFAEQLNSTNIEALSKSVSACSSTANSPCVMTGA